MECIIEESKETLARLETDLCEEIKKKVNRVGVPIMAQNLDLSAYADNGFYGNVMQMRADEEGDIVFEGNFEGFKEVALEDAVSDGYLSAWDLIAILENLTGLNTVLQG